MKYLVLLAVVLVLWWLLRPRRLRDRDRPAAPPGATEDMVECAQCGLHLPRGEALPGRGGLFCCEAHRSAYEQAHPR